MTESDSVRGCQGYSKLEYTFPRAPYKAPLWSRHKIVLSQFRIHPPMALFIPAPPKECSRNKTHCFRMNSEIGMWWIYEDRAGFVTATVASSSTLRAIVVELTRRADEWGPDHASDDKILHLYQTGNPSCEVRVRPRGALCRYSPLQPAAVWWRTSETRRRTSLGSRRKTGENSQSQPFF